MSYPHWHDLTPAEQAASWLNEAAALSSRRKDYIPPMASSRAESINTAENTKRKHVRGNGKRKYASKYVGVTTQKGRYISVWGASAKPIRSRRYPLTPEGELQAATERAKALGLPAPELR